MRILPLFERLLLIAVAVLVLVLLAFVVAWHVKWNAMQAQIAALVPRPGIVIMQPPAQDAQVWADYLAWGRRGELLNVFQRSRVDAWVNGDVVPAPAHLDQMRTLVDSGLRDWDGLLARGLRPALNPVPMPINGYDLAYGKCPLVVRAWAFCARMDGDPTAALAGMGRMEAALSPMNREGFLLSYRIDYFRDRLCLVAELENRLPAAARRAWHDQPDRVPSVVPAREYDRLFEMPAWHRANFAMDPLSWWHEIGPGDSWSMWRYRGGNWWTSPEQCAMDSVGIAQCEADLIAGTGGTDPWLSEVLGVAAMHRYSVLADDVIVMRRDSGALPEAPALDLSGGKYRLPLKYLKLDADRFAIVVDQAAPVAKDVRDIAAKALPDLTAPRSARRVNEDQESGIIIDCVGSGR